MVLKLEIRRNNTSFVEVDLFPDSQLEYDVDFYDTLDVSKIRLPFSSDMKIPMTELNMSQSRFNYNPNTDLKDLFPKDDFYFKITIYGPPLGVDIEGILTVKAFEYLSDEPYIDINLNDYVSKYISDLKDSTIAEVYERYSSSWATDTYDQDRTMNTFFDLPVFNGESGQINVNPDDRPIIFPYIDFCNDVDGKFGYEARQFTEYGVGMDRAGIVPTFSVKNFLTAIGDWLTYNGFNTRVDSKLFGLNYTSAIADFQPEKLQMLIPCKLEADKDVNTREFHLNQAPFWVGTNENMSGTNNSLSNRKQVITRWFFNNETFGNYGAHTDGEGGLTISNTLGTNYGLDVTDAPYPDDGQDGKAGNERGYFAPFMSFKSGITYNSGNNFASVSQIQYEIPIFGEDRLTYQIDPTDPASTMTFAVFAGVYQDGYQIKKIRLEDSNGAAVVLNASAATAVQGNSDKTSHQSSPTHQFFYDEDFSEFVVFDSNFQNVRDMLVWDEIPDLYLPSELEIDISSESRYGVNYYIEPIDGELKAEVGVTSVSHGSHWLIVQTNTFNYTTSDIRKAITRSVDYAQMDLKFLAIANYNPYFDNDITNLKESLENTVTITPFDALINICKRFGCGLFYEYDSNNNKNVLRVDPLHIVRNGSEDINDMVDDLKSVKVFIGGSKFKNLVLTNKDFNLFFDDEDDNGITIGSTTQELNADGVADFEIKLDSSIYYKSVCGNAIEEATNQNLEEKIISESEIGFTKNLFTKHQEIGVRFAYVDKPLYKTRLKRPKVVNFTHRPNIKTLTQKIYEDWRTFTFNGRLFHYNTAGYNLMAEDEDGITTDYYDLISSDEKILQSESPTIEFDMVIATSELSSLDFFFKTLNASRINQSDILVKSAKGEVLGDYAYLTITGLLQ